MQAIGAAPTAGWDGPWESAGQSMGRTTFGPSQAARTSALREAAGELGRSRSLVGGPAALPLQEQGVRRPQAVEHLAQSPIDPASGMDVDVEDALVLRAQEQFPEPPQLVAPVACPEGDEPSEMLGHSVRFDDDKGETVRFAQGGFQCEHDPSGRSDCTWGPGQADSVPLRGHFTEMMLSVIFTGESEIAVD
ncbi:hypothetical protein ACWGR4_40965 [Embleya sp. NPDC055664]